MVMKFYSPEFKADAVALYLSDPDLTLAGVAEDLVTKGAPTAASVWPGQRGAVQRATGLVRDGVVGLHDGIVVIQRDSGSAYRCLQLRRGEQQPVQLGL